MMNNLPSFLIILLSIISINGQSINNDLIDDIRFCERKVLDNRDNVYDSILFYAEKQHELALKLNDSIELGKAYLILGIAHNNLDDNINDLTFLIRSRDLFKKLKNQDLLARTNLEMASLYREARSELFSPDLILQAVKVHFEKSGDLDNLARTYLELGLHHRANYNKSKKTDSILYYYSKCKNIADRQVNRRLSYAAMNNISDYYLLQPHKNLDTVIHLSDKIISSQFADTRNIAVAFLNKSIALQEKGDKEHLDNLLKGYQLSKLIRPVRIQRAAANILYQYYLSQNDFELALQYYKVSQLKESSKKRRYQNMVFDNMEKAVLINEQENRLVENNLKKQRTLSYFLSSLLLLLVTFSIIFYRNNRTIKNNSAEIQKKNENIQWLLKEIHHRVKNNLQMIVGLLELQHTSISDDHASMVLNDASSRVKSIALIHQNLYSGDTNIVSIGFKKYVEELIHNLMYSYKKREIIQVELDIDELKLSFDKAVVFGLLITELVTNVLKHAFINKNSGLLFIKVKKDKSTNEVLMQVKDNGVGLPKNFSENQDSLGVDLIHSLVKDLDGSISYKSDQGTCVNIVFKQLNN